MISVEMEDVLAVLQLCKPYIIDIIAALVIGIVIMVACRRMSRDKRFLIRGEAVIAMVLAVVRSEERRVGKECRSRWSPYH